MNPEQPQSDIEQDSSDTCALCQNGGFCPEHSVRPANISELKHYDVISDDEEINAELQRAVNTKRHQDFANNKEAAEYFASLRKKASDSDQKAS